MATVQQLSDALAKADAAGDTAGAKVLADTIRQQQSLGAKLPGDAAPAAAQQTQAGAPSFLGSTLATLNHAVTDLPVAGPAIQWAGDNLAAQTIGRLSGQDPAAWLQHAQAARDANDAANPIAGVAGGVASNLAAAMAAGGTNLGGEALGFTGKMLPGMVDGSFMPGKIAASGMSQLGLSTLDNMARGNSPAASMQAAVGPSLVAAGMPLVSQAVGSGLQAGTDAVNGLRQRAATSAAIAGAPAADALKSSASQAFDAATGGNPLAVSDNAYMRFMGDVRQAVAKYRPNAANDPQSVGLLSHLMDLADAANTPGTVVDLKDLHLARQLAGKVAQSPSGRDSAIGSIVVDKLDDFINGLKPTDVLGGSDPSQAASNLMSGISGWNRATKVGVIESAIDKADTYKTGMENGLKTAFSNLMRSPDYQRFSPQEQDAIREVAKGTPVQNALSMLGKMGFSPGGGASHNIIGGTIGMGASSAALAPFLGPMAPAAGMGASMLASKIGRDTAEKIATGSANRAAQIAATPNIPLVQRLQLPAAVQAAPQGLSALMRAMLMAQQAGQ